MRRSVRGSVDLVDDDVDTSNDDLICRFRLGPFCRPMRTVSEVHAVIVTE